MHTYSLWGNTYIHSHHILVSDLIMVSCYTPGTQTPCSNGALAGVFLYTGTGSELNVADGDTVKLQIITNAYVCDDAGFVPTEYCFDWGDGTKSTGTFKSGYGEPKNEELTHVYRYNPDAHYSSTSYVPTVTIKTACGGVRTTTGRDQGVSLIIYCHQPGTTTIPVPTMSSYKRHPDFGFSSCAGIFPDGCTDGEVKQICSNNYYQKCVEGFWERDLSAPCGNDGGYVPPADTGGGGYVPPYTGGGGTGGDDGDGSDIMSSIMDFYEGNKLLAIGGVALLGGLVWFGGGGD